MSGGPTSIRGSRRPACCGSTKSHQWLRKFSGLDPLVVEALLAEDTRPRCSEIGDGLLIILRGVNLKPGADAEDMVAIRLWIDRRRIISTRHRHLKSIQDIRDQIAARHGPRGPGDFLVQIADRLTTRMGPIIDEIEETLDTLQDELPRSGDNDIGARLGPARRKAAQLRRYLAPQREDVNILGIRAWVIGPYLKVIGEYQKTLEKYPNPNLTEFGR